MTTKKEREAKALAVDKKRRASYYPSPPAFTDDAIDLKTKADITNGKMKHDSTEYFGAEVIIKAMRFAYKLVGEKAFSLYAWSPHSATAIEEVQRRNNFENDFEDF